MLILLSGQVDTSAIRYTQTMNFVFQVIFTVIGVFLSVVLTRLLARNGQVLREIRDLGREIRDLGRRMDERTDKLGEMIREMDGRTERIAEMAKGISEQIAKTSELIAAEGDKTRELIKILKMGRQNSLKEDAMKHNFIKITAIFFLLFITLFISCKKKEPINIEAPWRLATSSADWSARRYHTSVVFDNKIWVLGGYDYYYGYKNDVWYWP